MKAPVGRASQPVIPASDARLGSSRCWAGSSVAGGRRSVVGRRRSVAPAPRARRRCRRDLLVPTVGSDALGWCRRDLLVPTVGSDALRWCRRDLLVPTVGSDALRWCRRDLLQWIPVAAWRRLLHAAVAAGGRWSVADGRWRPPHGAGARWCRRDLLVPMDIPVAAWRRLLHAAVAAPSYRPNLAGPSPRGEGALARVRPAGVGRYRVPRNGGATELLFSEWVCGLRGWPCGRKDL